MKKLHLIDGTFELFRAHYSAPSATSPSGAEVGATRGLLRNLLALLREHAVTHVAIAFDSVIESFRNQLFDGYKTGAGIEPALLAQFPLAERAAAALGLVVWPMVEFEADDAIATAVGRWSQQVEQTVICSPDKDFGQLVRGESVVLHDRIRRLTHNEAAITAKFGVSPASIPDWLALVGDSADGFPGVPKWGNKSAATLLAHYRHIEHIPRDAAQWPMKVRGAETLAKSLREHEAAVLLYRTLATLRYDAPISQELEALRWHAPNRAALDEFCASIGDSFSYGIA